MILCAVGMLSSKDVIVCLARRPRPTIAHAKIVSRIAANCKMSSLEFRLARCSSAATSRDPRAVAVFQASELPFGNRVLTMISVWLEG